jgi:RNAse (barnase) inhibitor barstar
MARTFALRRKDLPGRSVRGHNPTLAQPAVLGRVALAAMTTYEIDGRDFSTLDGFYDEISRVLIPGAFWGRNLDAFDDVLYGGFGTPDERFALIWKNHELSRDVLGQDFVVLMEILRDHESKHHVKLTLA